MMATVSYSAYRFVECLKCGYIPFADTVFLQIRHTWQNFYKGDGCFEKIPKRTHICGHSFFADQTYFADTGFLQIRHTWQNFYKGDGWFEKIPKRARIKTQLLGCTLISKPHFTSSREFQGGQYVGYKFSCSSCQSGEIFPTFSLVPHKRTQSDRLASGAGPGGWSPPLKPTKVTWFTMILYNFENSIRHIQQDRFNVHDFVTSVLRSTLFISLAAVNT